MRASGSVTVVSGLSGKSIWEEGVGLRAEGGDLRAESLGAFGFSGGVQVWVVATLL
jgi:hypothetical protein